MINYRYHYRRRTVHMMVISGITEILCISRRSSVSQSVSEWREREKEEVHGQSVVGGKGRTFIWLTGLTANKYRGLTNQGTDGPCLFTASSIYPLYIHYTACPVRKRERRRKGVWGHVPWVWFADISSLCIGWPRFACLTTTTTAERNRQLALIDGWASNMSGSWAVGCMRHSVVLRSEQVHLRVPCSSTKVNATRVGRKILLGQNETKTWLTDCRPREEKRKDDNIHTYGRTVKIKSWVHHILSEWIGLVPEVSITRRNIQLTVVMVQCFLLHLVI